MDLTKKTFRINEDDINNAKQISSLLISAKARKRAFISFLGLGVIADALKKEGINANTENSIHKATFLLNDFEIADLCANDARIETRVIVGDSYPQMWIPKHHYEYGIQPDFYVGVLINPGFSEANVIGFIDSKEVANADSNNNYFHINTEDLTPFSQIKTAIKRITKTACGFSDFHHERAKELYTEYIDGQISIEDKKFLTRHLAACSNCISDFQLLYDFNVRLKDLSKYPELTKDYTLDIFHGVFPAQEEIVKINLNDNIEEKETEEESREDDLNDLLEDFEQNEEEANVGTETQDDLTQSEDLNEITIEPDEDILEEFSLDLEDENSTFLQDPEPLLEEEENQAIQPIQEPETEPIVFEQNNITTLETPEETEKKVDDLEDIESLLIEEPESQEIESNKESFELDALLDELEFGDEQDKTTEEESAQNDEEQVEIEDFAEEPSTNLTEQEEFLIDNKPEEIIIEDIETQLSKQDPVQDYQNDLEPEVLDLLENNLDETEQVATFEETSDDISSLLNTPDYDVEISDDEAAQIAKELAQELGEEFLADDDALAIGQKMHQKASKRSNPMPAILLTAAIIGAGYWVSENPQITKKYPQVAPVVEKTIILRQKISKFIPFLQKEQDLKPVLTDNKIKPIVNNQNNEKTDDKKLTESKDIENKNIKKVSNEKTTPAVQQTPKTPVKKQKEIIAKNVVSKKTIMKSKSIDDSLAKAFESDHNAVRISKISWEVGSNLASNPEFKKYLVLTGRAVKINLSQELLTATELTLTDTIKVNLTLNKQGNPININISKSSGSDQVDTIVLQTVKETLKYTKMPKFETNKTTFNAGLIINL